MKSEIDYFSRSNVWSHATSQSLGLKCVNLLVGGDGAEDDLAEALRGEHVKADAADDAAVLDEHEALVLGVEDEARDVLAGHARQLVREDVLEHEQPDEDLCHQLFVNNHYLNLYSNLTYVTLRDTRHESLN